MTSTIGRSKTTAFSLEKAARLPVGFAQVREDPNLDLLVSNKLGQSLDICMVASGGCTAAVLATQKYVKSLHLVDPSCAQLSLTKLKLHLLENHSTAERMSLLGHKFIEPERRLAKTAQIARQIEIEPAALCTNELLAELGLDFCGRYEMLFAAFRDKLRPDQSSLDSLLDMTNPLEQSAFLEKSGLDQGFAAAFQEVFSLENLIALFGKKATANPLRPFADHFQDRLAHCLSVMPARDNPFVQSMLAGQYEARSFPDWLALPQGGLRARVEYRLCSMLEALKDRPRQFDFVHLSNILDWLSPEAAADTLETAYQSLKPAGMVFIRQLNSNLDIANLHDGFYWRVAAAKWQAKDRSFFYRNLAIGQKRL